MKDSSKTKAHLIEELAGLRERVAELELAGPKESEERYRAIFEQAADSIVLVDAETGELVEFNDRAYENLGYTREEFARLRIHDFEAIETAEEVEKHIEKIAKEGSDTFETKHRTKGGDTRYILVSSRAISIDRENFIQSIWRDITDQKRTEEELRTSENRLAIAVAATGLGIYEHRVPLGKECYHSERWAEILGYEVDELPAPEGRLEWVLQQIHPDDRQTLEKAYTDFTEGHIPKYEVEVRIKHKSGEWVYVSAISGALDRDENGRVTHLVGVMQDVTDRKRAEEALRDSEERYRTLFEGVPVGLYRTTPDGQILDVNPALVEMLGYPDRDSLLAINVSEGYVYPEDQSRWKRMLEQKIVIREHESQWRKYDGTVIWVKENARAVYDEKNTLLYYEGSAEDITGQKRTEIALVESEEKYRRLFSTVSDSIMIFDAETLQFIDINDAALQLYGYTREEFLNLKYENITAEPEKSLESAAETLQDKRFALSVGYHKKKNGTVFPVEISASSFDLSGQTVLCGVIRDITDRIQVEEKIRNSLHEKEILLQEIHHRVKNNIQIVSSLLNLQSLSIKDDRIKDILDKSQERIRTMALVHEKLYQTDDFSSLDFKDYVMSLTSYLMQIYEGIKDRVEIDLNMKDIRFDMDKAIPCGLIINELVSNSMKYAFPEDKSGKIEISLQKNRKGEVRLAVSDNGIGLPGSFEISKIKTLGLHMVNLLVKDQLRGKLNVVRKRGSEFVITFCM